MDYRAVRSFQQEPHQSSWKWTNQYYQNVKPTLLETKKSSSGDKFEDALKRELSKATEDERMEEPLSESEEDLDTGRPQLKRGWQGPTKTMAKLLDRVQSEGGA